MSDSGDTWVKSDDPRYLADARRRFHLNYSINETTGCWEWRRARTHSGYGWACWRTKTIAAHRLAWMLLIGEIGKGLWVLHKCDNPPCVNPDHLYLGNARQNTDDRLTRNRGARGERHGSAKLTIDQVRQIRSLYQGRGRGPSYESLMRQFHVSKSTIAYIVNGKSWEDFINGGGDAHD